MKKLLATYVLLHAFCLFAEGKCACQLHVSVYNKGVLAGHYEYEVRDTIPDVVYIYPGDSIRFYAMVTQDCSWDLGEVLYNGVTVCFFDPYFAWGGGYLHTAFDTGRYSSTLICMGYLFSYKFYLAYYPNTDITDISRQNTFLISPSVSSGIFQITSGQQQQRVKKITIMDGLGKTVLVSNAASEINLTAYSNGIYFYAIEDEKQGVYRGKIVKE